MAGHAVITQTGAGAGAGVAVAAADLMAMAIGAAHGGRATTASVQSGVTAGVATAARPRAGCLALKSAMLLLKVCLRFPLALISSTYSQAATRRARPARPS